MNELLRRTETVNFGGGIVAGLLLVLIVMDCRGQAEMIRMMERDWVPSSQTQPIQVTFLIIVMTLVISISVAIRMKVRSMTEGLGDNPKAITFRKCEKCGGPGPCLWDSKCGGRYVCRSCHSEPDSGPNVRFFRGDHR